MIKSIFALIFLAQFSFAQEVSFENFVNSGKIKEFDKMPSGACIRKLPYANPDAAP